MASTLCARAAQYPVVTVTGPRQAGKTTLCRQTFADRPYANLERPDTREQALTDPAGFLAQFPNGAVLDEIQRVPPLLSWLQVDVDERPQPGRWILTGSHQFELMRGIGQSLAGRTALLQLWPLSLAELAAGGIAPGVGTTTVDDLLFNGGYPRIHADRLDAQVALADYFATYVERDLRQLIELRQLDTFRRFVRLAAGRVGQLLNLSSLAADAGVSAPTSQAWVTLLEASGIVHRLPPWHAHLGKRLVKQAKLYFCDTGLAAWLIGVREAGQMATHPLRGALFENLVVNEFAKHALNQGFAPDLHFFRDRHGLEVDLLVGYGLPPGRTGLVEIKSGQTVQREWLMSMNRVATLLGPQVGRRMLVHGGIGQGLLRDGVELVGIGAGAPSSPGFSPGPPA
ncbi:MAG: ATP-binding protein [Rubrivivax sp.]|nr:ATP-binding protein [Rubrivivax sp.]